LGLYAVLFAVCVLLFPINNMGRWIVGIKLGLGHMNREIHTAESGNQNRMEDMRGRIGDAATDADTNIGPLLVAGKLNRDWLGVAGCLGWMMTGDDIGGTSPWRKRKLLVGSAKVGELGALIVHGRLCSGPLVIAAPMGAYLLEKLSVFNCAALAVELRFWMFSGSVLRSLMTPARLLGRTPTRSFSSHESSLPSDEEVESLLSPKMLYSSMSQSSIRSTLSEYTDSASSS
jgi:hypothetical protein